MRAPGRREIGHGKLAWRAIRPLLPQKAEFPYTIRVVSEVTESNGSSSMASVCGASLAMMDAGVPLRSAVAGIAMGLIKEGERYAVLSDIMGDEDHLGDMDFKVAGTEAGITALQMDIKINGITTEIMAKALEQAKAGRLHILGKMSESLSNATGLKNTAPRITTLTIDKERIGELIGPGGKVIREICESTGAKIDVDDTGVVKVAAVNQEMGDDAVRRIREIFEEAEMGKIYDGKVSKLLEFGAVVQFLGKCSGLVHISEISGERIAQVEDALSVGQPVKVKVIGKERGDRGDRIRLSMRRVNQETGEEIPGAAGEDENGGEFQPRERRERSDRGGERRSSSSGGRRDDRRGGDDRPRYNNDRREGGERVERRDRPDRGGERRDRGPRPGGERNERRPERHDDDQHNRHPKARDADDNFGNRIEDAAVDQPKKRRWFL
jgi:polyribonucleotide nucleotidyltransferase